MIGVLICTHGNSANALLKSAEMICGKQENCQTVKFEVGEPLDKLRKELDEKITALSGSVLCLTDLKGGTPFNKLVELLEQHPKIEIVTGVNIPMLLELFISRNQIVESKLIEKIINAGRDGIYQYKVENSVNDDEEF